MKNLPFQLLSTLFSAGVALLVVNASSVQAFTISFQQDFGDDGILSGEFTGTDLNSDDRLDRNEFTSLTALFEGTESGFESVSWRLSHLTNASFFVSPIFYNLVVADPLPFPNGRGFRSNSELRDTVVGYASSSGQFVAISNRFQVQEPLQFTDNTAAIPEPVTIAGALTAAGLGLMYRTRKLRSVD